MTMKKRKDKLILMSIQKQFIRSGQAHGPRTSLFGVSLSNLLRLDITKSTLPQIRRTINKTLTISSNRLKEEFIKKGKILWS